MPELVEAIKMAFKDAEFNRPFDSNSPIVHTVNVLTGPDSKKYCHVIAENEGVIVGACLAIPAFCNGSDDADPGWLFAPDKSAAHEIISTAHTVLRQAGFKRVVTNMGTAAGAKFLSRYHNYVLIPGQENQWRKEL